LSAGIDDLDDFSDFVTRNVDVAHGPLRHLQGPVGIGYRRSFRNGRRLFGNALGKRLAGRRNPDGGAGHQLGRLAQSGSGRLQRSIGVAKDQKNHRADGHRDAHQHDRVQVLVLARLVPASVSRLSISSWMARKRRESRVFDS